MAQSSNQNQQMLQTQSVYSSPSLSYFFHFILMQEFENEINIYIKWFFLQLYI